MANKTAYLIGIKGVGMTALAVYLKELGYEVSGSDVDEPFVTDAVLLKEGISYNRGFDGANLKTIKPDLVVVSAAYGRDNSEVKVARQRHLNLKYYSEVLAQVSGEKKVIAVSGIHGKTTITAMLSYLLEKAGLSPNFIIGSGNVPNFNKNAQKGEGDYFVIEADEYRKSPDDLKPKFLDLEPFIAIISSIEMDHPDMFSSLENVYNAFYRLACRVPRNGFIVLCEDYPKAQKLRQTLADRNFETYGFSQEAKWRIVGVSDEEFSTSFSIDNLGKIYGPFPMKVFGNHNILNATAAIVTCLKIEIDEKIIKKYLKNFIGVQRRFEEIGKINDIRIYDDYAHHPTAINMTLQAARKKFPKSKIWCIFQPHTFSRTEKLFKEFAKAFRNADRVVITDIFTSAREKEGKTTGADLAEEIKKHQSGVRFFSDLDKIKEFLKDSVQPPAVIITMGAGDIYKLSRDLKGTFE